MPPYLALPYFHLSKLPLSTKVVLSGFCLSISAAAVFTGIWYFPARLDRKEGEGMIRSTQRHFAPHEETREQLEREGAPAADIEQAVRTQYEGSVREAFDIIHPHAFLMPVVFFVLCHLTEMTTVARAVRIGLYGLALAGLLLTVWAPLLVLHAPWLALPCVAGLYAMLGSFTLLAILTGVHLWVARPEKT